MKKIIYIISKKIIFERNGLIECDGTHEIYYYIIKDNIPILMFTEELDISENSIDNAKQLIIAELYNDEDSCFNCKELVEYIGDTKPTEVEFIEL